MLARIRNLLRVFSQMQHQEGEEVIVVHDLKVNLRSRRVNRGGEYLDINAKRVRIARILWPCHVNEACNTE